MNTTPIPWKQKPKAKANADKPHADQITELSAHIIGLMEEQYQRYGEVAELVVEQRRALVQNQLEALQSVNAKADGVVTELAFIESERAHVAAKLFALCEGGVIADWKPISNAPVDGTSQTVRCDELIPHLPPRMAEGLDHVRVKLRDRLSQLRKDFAINEALALNGRKIIHTTLGILTSVVGRTGIDKHQVYGPQGKASYGRTQVRTLINRQV